MTRKENCDRVRPDRPDALYVHVPFCTSKCRYCDFYSRPINADDAEEFVAAIEHEWAVRVEVVCKPLRSIFVGGGTPTSLGAERLGTLLRHFHPWRDETTEFTVEANPGTLTKDIIAALSAAGVNRVSLGAQSFDDATLHLLGRSHCADDITAAATALHNAGIHNLSLDLIYGVPTQTPASWNESLRRALDLGIEHLSCYALSYESGTPLSADLSAGRVVPMLETDQRVCYDAAITATVHTGMEHYEISNFARPGRQCRHNLVYWHNRPYLGLGPSAVSYVDGQRSKTSADLPGYLAALSAGRMPRAEGERLKGPAVMAETVMLGLRLTAGISREAFRHRFGRDVTAVFPRSIQRYAVQGALVVTDAAVRLATDALFVADTVLGDIVAEASDIPIQ